MKLDETWAKFSIQVVVVRVPCFFYFYEAKRPNLKLKTRPKLFSGYLLLDIALIEEGNLAT
jgi:hypothetical protein